MSKAKKEIFGGVVSAGNDTVSWITEDGAIVSFAKLKSAAATSKMNVRDFIAALTDTNGGPAQKLSKKQLREQRRLSLEQDQEE